MKSCLTALAVLFCASAAPAASNLCVNGSFDNEDFALTGWNYDYAWLGNSKYADNHARVSTPGREGTHTSVVRIDATGTSETKIESTPIPFEQDAHYRCTMYVKGGPARVYLAGYKWEKGVRPHDDPKLGELRKIYKGKAYAETSRSWQKVTIDMPMKDLSQLGREHLKHVRFITVYIWSIGELFIDDVEVVRTK